MCANTVTEGSWTATDPFQSNCARYRYLIGPPPQMCWVSLIRVAPSMAKRKCLAGAGAGKQNKEVRLQRPDSSLTRLHWSKPKHPARSRLQVTLDLRSSSAMERNDLAERAKGLEETDIKRTKRKVTEKVRTTPEVHVLSQTNTERRGALPKHKYTLL